MKRVLYAIAAAIIVCTISISPQAHASPGDEFTRVEIVADVDQNGVFRVTQTMDLSFASSGHGPYVWFLTRQEYDDSHDRLYEYSSFYVTSPTGAPTDLETTRDSNTIMLRIGDPDYTVRGTQTYVITYTLKGIVNPNVSESNMDEIYWNAMPTGGEIPISNVSVTINAPASVSQTTCYMGADYTQPCTTHSMQGSSANFTQSSLSPGEGLAVVGGWPVGTFSGASINIVPRSQNPFSLAEGGGYAAGAAGVLSAIGGWVLTRIRRRGRDEQFANVTPGMLPAAGDKVEIKREEVKDAAVEFEPPGVPPRMVGAIVREGPSDEDITATIIDLAVRGYIHFDQGEGDDFTIRTTDLGMRSDPANLTWVEQKVYRGLFSKGPVLTRAGMADKDFYPIYQDFQQSTQSDFNAQGWYKTSPRAVMTVYVLGGGAIAVLGVLGSLWFGSDLARSGHLGFGWLAVPFALLGIGMVALAKRMPVRTPIGSAVAIRSLGFKKYLETAEAKQIRWEEGQDIFSRYLPYAISYGCADRWAKIFEELVAMGAPVPAPTWYTGHYGSHYPMWSSINNSINGIGSAFMDSFKQHAAAQAASSGSSGHSGFSGGGGGGGAGGGGSGSW